MAAAEFDRLATNSLEMPFYPENAMRTALANSFSGAKVRQ
jgi:hypothetical protein